VFSAALRVFSRRGGTRLRGFEGEVYKMGEMGSIEVCEFDI
jgi:hypothetical protein